MSEFAVSDEVTRQMLAAGGVPAEVVEAPVITPAVLREQARLAEAEARANETAAKRETRETRRLQAEARATPLAKFAGSSELIKISRREANAELTFIGEYSENDIVGYRNVEDFVAKTLRPKYGPGPYIIEYIDKNGKPIQRAPVRFPEEPMQQQALPFTSPREYAELQERTTRTIMETQRIADERAVAARSGNNDVGTALTMMADTLKIVLEKALTPPPPPPPLPPSAPDPMQGLMAEFLRSVLNKPDSGNAEMIQYMRDRDERERAAREKEMDYRRELDRIEGERRKEERERAEKMEEMRLKTQLQIAELNAKASGADPLARTLETLTAVTKIKELAGADQQGTSITDVLTAFAEKLPETIDKMAGMIREKSRATRMAQAPRTVPAMQAAQTPAQAETPAEEGTAQATFVFPAGFDRHVETMTIASEGEPAVRAFANALGLLQGHGAWSEHISSLVSLTLRNEQGAARQIIDQILGAFVESGQVTREVGLKIMRSCVDNWSAIVEAARVTAQVADSVPTPRQVTSSEPTHPDEGEGEHDGSLE